MARYPNGQPLHLTTTVRDVNGNLVNATSLSLTVKKPDATTQTYGTPANDSTGQYHQDIPTTDLTQNGHYQYVWTATGVGAGVSRGDFDVFDPFEAAVLPLQDAKDALNIAQSTTTYDNEIGAYLDTIEQSLEALTGGPLVNRSVSERTRVLGSNDNSFVLRRRPLVSVTSITNISSTEVLSLDDLDIDPVACTIMRKRELPFWGWGPWYQIVYVAGWGTAMPPAFNAAARIILKHLWRTERGPGLAPVPGMDETILPGMAFAIPNRAVELLRATDPTTGMTYLQEVYV